MRILQVSSANTFGGGERHFVDLCRELVERGHEVFVALRPSNEWQDRLDFIPRENFLFVSIRNSFGMFSAKKIGKFIEKQGIEIVHAHVARDYLAASVAVRMVKSVKLVLTRHVVFPMKPFHRFALKNVDAAIAVSPPVQEQLERIFPAYKVHTIPNGINVADDKDVDHGALGNEFRVFHDTPTHAPLIVTLGELKLLKGQRDLVLAANEVLKQIPTARFVVAGKDNSIDKRFRRELRRLVRVLGHDESFTWLDWLDDISPLMAAADLFVSPSHSESFGLAILDAMAAGTPVIATATDGAKQLITDRNAIVPIKDPIALAGKITWFIQHENERRVLGEKQKLHARKNYGLTTMIDATVALYEEILNG
ncbi:MAG: glycosyltransferase family 4 protein [Acidobacteria bacterium]|nr:glycosyltransferase family 4 protein [Acidobacteriota bacterium]